MRRVFATGSRKWNKGHYPDIELFLFDTMDSLVSNWLRGRKQRLKVEGDVDLDGFAAGENGSVDIAAYEEAVVAEFAKQLEQLGAEDDELLIFNARVYDGLTRPEEIRENIGMTEKEYHNAIRRLDRRLEKIRAKRD